MQLFLEDSVAEFVERRGGQTLVALILQVESVEILHDLLERVHIDGIVFPLLQVFDEEFLGIADLGLHLSFYTSQHLVNLLFVQRVKLLRE